MFQIKVKYLSWIFHGSILIFSHVLIIHFGILWSYIWHRLCQRGWGIDFQCIVFQISPLTYLVLYETVPGSKCLFKEKFLVSDTRNPWHLRSFVLHLWCFRISSAQVLSRWSSTCQHLSDELLALSFSRKTVCMGWRELAQWLEALPALAKDLLTPVYICRFRNQHHFWGAPGIHVVLIYMQAKLTYQKL